MSSAIHREVPVSIDRDRIHRIILISFTIVSTLAFARLARPTNAAAEPLAPGESRFGDSTWVAPNVYPDAEPSEVGPRVNGPDKESGWETALRTPFRVLFFPLRLVGGGLEQVANFGENYARGHGMGVTSLGDPRVSEGVRVSPRFTMSNTQGFGAGATVKAPLGPGNRFRGDALWSTKDNRFLRARGLFGEGVAAIGVGADGFYDYRPNRRFYGMGNDAGTQKTIYLQRENRGEGFVFFGRDSTQRVRAILGISDVHVGNGYGDTHHAADFFDPADVPSLQTDSRVWSYGLAGQYATVDRLHEASRGLHLLGEARRNISADGRDIRFRSWRLDSRGYIPVGNDRRVIALRGVYQGVDPENGSEAIPFYRLPVATGSNRFAAYSGDRFRDNRLVLAQAEYRWLILSSELWAFALAQRAVVAPSTSALRYSDMHEAYGGGLRYRLSQFQTARLDIARGSQGTTIDLDLDVEF
jgi:hypothetical protein